MTVTRKNTRDGSHVRVMAYIPKDLHERIVTLILLTNRSMAHYMAAGLRRVLSDAQRQWPKEYLFQTLEEKAAFAKATNRYRRRQPPGSTSPLTARLREANWASV